MSESVFDYDCSNNDNIIIYILRICVTLWLKIVVIGVEKSAYLSSLGINIFPVDRSGPEIMREPIHARRILCTIHFSNFGLRGR